MSVWSKIRGTATTALAWAVPWGILGGSLLLSFEIFRAPRNLPLSVYVSDGGPIFLLGVLYGGFCGAIAGALFAGRLRAWARAREAESLSDSRAVRLGALSGAGAVAVPMLVWAIASGRSPLLLTPMILLAAAAGAGSAYAMLALARRSSPVASGSLEERVAESGELRAAHSEVERLLIERHNLTTLGADGRASEAAAGPPLCVR